MPGICDTRVFIIVSATLRHLFLPWARWVQSTTLHTTSVRRVLILFFHLLLRLPSTSFLHISLANSCTHIFSNPYIPQGPVHLIFFDLNDMCIKCQQFPALLTEHRFSVRAIRVTQFETAPSRQQAVNKLRNMKLPQLYSWEFRSSVE